MYKTAIQKPMKSLVVLSIVTGLGLSCSGPTRAMDDEKKRMSPPLKNPFSIIEEVNGFMDVNFVEVTPTVKKANFDDGVREAERLKYYNNIKGYPNNDFAVCLNTVLQVFVETELKSMSPSLKGFLINKNKEKFDVLSSNLDERTKVLIPVEFLKEFLDGPGTQEIGVLQLKG